jgi:hypothetical protein
MGLAYMVSVMEKLPEIGKSLADTLTNSFNKVSQSLGLVAAILGAVFLSGTVAKIISGIFAMTKAMLGLVAVIRAVGIAQVITNAVVTKGASLALDLLAIGGATALGIGAYKAIMAEVEGLGEDNSNSDPSKPYQKPPGTVLGEIEDNAQSEYKKMMAFINGEKPGEGEPGKDDPSATAINRQTPVLKSIDSTLRDMRNDIRDMLLGGGAATSAKFNARNIAGWSNPGSGGGSGWAKVKQGFDEMIADHVASLGVSGVYRSQGR